MGASGVTLANRATAIPAPVGSCWTIIPRLSLSLRAELRCINCTTMAGSGVTPEPLAAEIAAHAGSDWTTTPIHGKSLRQEIASTSVTKTGGSGDIRDHLVPATLALAGDAWITIQTRNTSQWKTRVSSLLIWVQTVPWSLIYRALLLTTLYRRRQPRGAHTPR